MKITKKYLNKETICDEIKSLDISLCDVVSLICDEKIMHLGDKELCMLGCFGDWVHKTAQNTTIQTTRDLGNNIYRIIQAKNKKKAS